MHTYAAGNEKRNTDNFRSVARAIAMLIMVLMLVKVLVAVVVSAIKVEIQSFYTLY